MKANIINIGNSQGIILPKHMLKQMGINKEVELNISDKEITIKPIHKNNPREGWKEMLLKAKEAGETTLNDEDKDWLNFDIEIEDN
ncbi:MAG: AbrB/MazE/SpoVT family DNA-binding domain-containing protein [Bacteroidota bacterium]|nr:AbrB/MazE/SpoVT family DNA-binding domain-containing protein [Bacteroidota bacterium]